MPIRPTRTALAALTVAALTVPVGLVSPAAASDGGGSDVRTSGRCSGTAHWKLKAKADDGRIEVEGEIDSNRAGQVWRWTLKHNGSLSASGTKKTSGLSGSFQVERRMANLAGTDHFIFRATHRHQVCRGTISF
ncbi:MAG TPA: hypothetical protein VGK78_04185 [Nocardioides sp.]|uniref:hypothetical protein n=1 Tax=Nocardioides sp. TaxID=35761 RepID=UPI002F3EA525